LALSASLRIGIGGDALLAANQDQKTLPRVMVVRIKFLRTGGQCPVSGDHFQHLIMDHLDHISPVLKK
jgi:hypothetical protein